MTPTLKFLTYLAVVVIVLFVLAYLGTWMGVKPESLKP